MTAAQATHDRRNATLTWLGIFGGSVIAIVALHALGDDTQYAVEWTNLWQWLDGPPDRVLLALARVVALVLAYYIAGSMMLYAAARATKIPGLVRSVEWMTLPAIRRVTERAVAVSLTVSTLAGGGIAPAVAFSDTTPVPTPVIHRVADDGDVDVPIPFVTTGPSANDEGAPPVSTPTSDSEDDSVVLPPPFVVRTPQGESTPSIDVGPRFVDPTAAERSPTASTSGPKSAAIAYDYVVAKGDNMWVAAERHLEDVMGRVPSEAETATYWSHMIEVNRPLIRSGDPDLIFPGEIIVCPAVNEAGI